jgi:hypothetical protein
MPDMNSTSAAFGGLGVLVAGGIPPEVGCFAGAWPAGPHAAAIAKTQVAAMSRKALVIDLLRRILDQFPPAAQNPGREHDHGADELEGALEDNAQQSEGQKDQPDHWIEDQCQQGEGPAKDQQDRPQEELSHNV